MVIVRFISAIHTLEDIENFYPTMPSFYHEYLANRTESFERIGLGGYRDAAYFLVTLLQWIVDADLQTQNLPLQSNPVDTWRFFYDLLSSPGHNAALTVLGTFDSDNTGIENILNMTPEELTRIFHSKLISKFIRKAFYPLSLYLLSS